MKSYGSKVRRIEPKPRRVLNNEVDYIIIGIFIGMMIGYFIGLVTPNIMLSLYGFKTMYTEISRERLLSRGYCCSCGCKNCPYIPRHRGTKYTNRTEYILSQLLIILRRVFRR